MSYINDDFDKEFNKDFYRADRTLKWWFIFIAAMAIGALGFTGWIVLQLLRHFGII